MESVTVTLGVSLSTGRRSRDVRTLRTAVGCRKVAAVWATAAGCATDVCTNNMSIIGRTHMGTGGADLHAALGAQLRTAMT